MSDGAGRYPSPMLEISLWFPWRRATDYTTKREYPVGDTFLLATSLLWTLAGVCRALCSDVSKMEWGGGNVGIVGVQSLSADDVSAAGFLTVATPASSATATKIDLRPAPPPPLVRAAGDRLGFPGPVIAGQHRTSHDTSHG